MYIQLIYNEKFNSQKNKQQLFFLQSYDHLLSSAQIITWWAKGPSCDQHAEAPGSNSLTHVSVQQDEQELGSRGGPSGNVLLYLFFFFYVFFLFCFSFPNVLNGTANFTLLIRSFLDITTTYHPPLKVHILSSDVSKLHCNWTLKLPLHLTCHYTLLR